MTLTHRFQFRLSTLLLLMFCTACWLGLNFYPKAHLKVNTYKADKYNPEIINILLEQYWVYGWPCGVYVAAGQQYDTTPWQNPASQSEVEKYYGIEKSYQTYFIPKLETGAFSWNALLTDLWFYVWNMAILYWVLERKQKVTSPPASNAG